MLCYHPSHDVETPLMSNIVDLTAERIPIQQRLCAKITPRIVLIGIVIVAVVLRVASAIFQGDTVVAFPGVFDQLSYNSLALRVSQGTALASENSRGH